MSSNDSCKLPLPSPPTLTRSPSAMSLTTPCSTTMKVAGLTPFQSFLLRPADTRSVVVFIVACICTFFVLLHVKKVADSFSPPASSEHGMSARSHQMTTLSVNEIIPPTIAPPPTCYRIISFTSDMTGSDGQLLHPLTTYIPQLSSQTILSLHSLTITTTSTQPSHYHTTISKLFVLQHGSITFRLIDVDDGHFEEVTLSVKETQDQPIAILIHPNVCHTFIPKSDSDMPIRMLSYSLRSMTSGPSPDPIKLLLSDRHTCQVRTPIQDIVAAV